MYFRRHPRRKFEDSAPMAPPASVAPQTPPHPDLSDAAISRRFQARREFILRESVACVVPGDPAQGSKFDVAACLARGENLPAALARLARLDGAPPSGDMFWVYPTVSVMMAGRHTLDEPSRDRIADLWRTYWPSRGDTENHWVLSYASLYLAAQAYPEAGPDQWFNGRSSAENRAEARDYLNHWINVTTSHGQGEYDSPNYIEEYAIGLAMLAGWADEPAFRDRAKRMLDYILYDYAVETLDGLYGGAHSRVYPRHIMAPARTAAAALGWMLFGLGDYEPSERQVTRHQLREELPERGAKLIALSGYTPPPILERIARDRSTPYVELERKRTRWRMRHAGPESFVVGDRRTVAVHKTTYVDPDFILGSSQGGLLQPIQQQTWGLIWRTEKPIMRCPSFFGCQPYASAIEGSMYFPVDPDVVTDLITRSKADYDSPDKLPGGSPYEQVMQSGTALIALQHIPADALFRHITLFFSRDLENTVEDDSGWIFAQGGPVYIGVRPFAAGEWRANDWTGFLAGGAGGILVSGDFDEWGVGHRCWVSEAARNGYVVQVAPTRDFSTYSEFMDTVRALPLAFSLDPTPTATFTGLDGTRLEARYGSLPVINDTPVDPTRWPLFDSPFGQSEVGSRQLTLRHGDETLQLDFTDVPWDHSTQPPAPEMPATLAIPDDVGPTLYAAATMTGNQRNTATPSDAGLFQRLPSGVWTNTGPRILGVASVAIHPTTPAVKLIASADGIVRTADNGVTWRKTTGWQVADVRAITFDSGNPDTVYAATMWGPLRSENGGQSWGPTPQGLDRLYSRTLLADRAQPGRVLLGMEEGLYVSTDAALTWAKLDFPTATVTQITQSPVQPNLFLVSTLGHGAWQSQDRGQMWTLIDPTTANLYAAALAPHDPAVMATGGWETGVRISTDNGETWQDRNAGLPNRRIFVLAFDPHQPGRLWASTFEQGTFTSDDLGQTWQDAGLHGAYGADFVFHGNPDHVGHAALQ
ncbi:WD40/YVTN/BNR-like repeat-containing protein [Synoicihabitans lomoniglobus]|uniref:Uncharacterized protein n=1 Tax=Synoicihabitans lomoniglobus TaxID=2909285 RepID=A0AAF0CIA3_9BACT|nr:hypothetical protein [Opitutaceae bacterium LMO-M01]WED65162.1 hypothetical protein PXH66_22725 [Opitutaceae bacterium LMO-M01]